MNHQSNSKSARTLKIAFAPEYQREWANTYQAELCARRAILHALRDPTTSPRAVMALNEVLEHLESAMDL